MCCLFECILDLVRFLYAFLKLIAGNTVDAITEVVECMFTSTLTLRTLYLIQKIRFCF
jgi:hypothetical protein